VENDRPPSFQGASDWWEFARFQAVIVAWSWFRQNGVFSSHPPLGARIRRDSIFMTNVVLDESSKLRYRRRSRGIFVAFMTLFVILGLASYNTTAVVWDGAFPSGEYHLRIQSEGGVPIEAAILNIYHGRTQAFKYPFDNYLSENSLVSNKKGEIVITHASRGFEFGGTSWLLFWAIPIDMGSPKFNCEIIASGYQALEFSVQQIFETAYKNENAPMKTVQINGEEVELKVFEQSVVLKEK
jgi:hypothetical protein